MVHLGYRLLIVAGVMLASFPGIARPDEFGDLIGTVLLEGKVPAKYRSARIVETPNGGGVKAVAVYLRTPVEKPHPSFPPANQSMATVELANGTVSPVLGIAQVGGRLEVVNREADTVLIKLSGLDISESNFIKSNERLRVRVNSPEVSPAVTIYEVHGHHRQAWIVAPPTPYATITDEKGKFAICRLPVGRHTMAVWSPYVTFSRVLKRSRAEVNIRAGQTTQLAPIVLSADDFD